PYTLGIEVSRELGGGRLAVGHFSPIIERNSIVPISREERFQTLRDNQKEIQVDVYQGEHRMVENNIKLGGVSVEVPAGLAGEQSVEVRFTYNVNGLLEVEVQVVGTDKMKKLVIDSGDNQMSEAEIKACFEKLAHLKIHPRDNQENRAILARAERIYQEILGDNRQFLAAQIERFEYYIEQQDGKQIAVAREQLSGVLDQLEGESRF
nr:Hsp70 family protein [Granulosicoccus sp.]